MVPSSSVHEKYVALQSFLLACEQANVVPGPVSRSEAMTKSQAEKSRKRIAELLGELPNKLTQFSDQEIVQIFHAVCRQ